VIVTIKNKKNAIKKQNSSIYGAGGAIGEAVARELAWYNLYMVKQVSQ